MLLQNQLMLQSNKRNNLVHNRSFLFPNTFLEISQFPKNNTLKPLLNSKITMYDYFNINRPPF